MLSINTVARVIVNTVQSTSSPAAFNVGLLLVKDTNFAAARRLQAYDSAADAVAGLTEYGFGDATDPYKAAVKYFAASPAPSRLLVSCYPTSESLSEALDAVLDLTAGFYGVMTCETLTAANWLAFAQYVAAQEQPLMLFVPVTGTVADAVAADSILVMLFVPVTGTVADAVAADSILDKLHGAQIKRAVPFYCAAVSDCAAVMGTAMGLELSHTASAFALCYKTINGIVPSDLTQTQVNSLQALGCNVYVVRGYTHYLLEKGTVASGMRYDEVLYADKIANDLQNAAVTLLADNPDKMPQTDDSTAIFMTRFSSILMNYTEMNVLATSVWRGSGVGPIATGDVIENGFLLWADSYDDQTDADRAAHKAMPVSVALTMAGSIESIVITVNLQI